MSRRRSLTDEDGVDGPFERAVVMKAPRPRTPAPAPMTAPRPRTPDPHTERLNIRLTREELDTWTTAARADGRSLSAWIRRQVGQAIKR